MAITISGNAATTRTNLGLGTASTLDTGTSANQVLKLDSNGKIPAVDGTQITNINSARQWNLPAFYAYNENAFTLNSTSWTSITTELDTTTLNTSSAYSTTTGRFTPNVAGWYYFEGQIHADNGSGQLVNLFALVEKNGVAVTQGEANEGSANANEQSVGVAGMTHLNGSSDFLQIRYYNHDTSGSGSSQPHQSNFFGWLVIPDA